MFSLTIAVGNTSWSLLYKNEEHALVGAQALKNATVNSFGAMAAELTDDFGQTAYVTLPCAGFLIESLDQSKKAHIERSLHQARTTIEAQNAWKNDPAARASMTGPSVLTPGMMSRNGGFTQ